VTDYIKELSFKVHDQNYKSYDKLEINILNEISCASNANMKKQIDVTRRLVWIPVIKHGSHMNDYSEILILIIFRGKLCHLLSFKNIQTRNNML
jgi:hypothetical protein